MRKRLSKPFMLLLGTMLLAGCSEQVTRSAAKGGIIGGAGGLGVGIVRGDALEKMAEGALGGAFAGAAAGFLAEQEQGAAKSGAPATTGQPAATPQPTALSGAPGEAPTDAEREERIRKLVEVANTGQTSGGGLIGGGTVNDDRYRIGIRDVLEVKVFQAEELNHTTRVDSSGYISLPLLGRLRVAGLTVSEAEELIQQKLGESYLQNPHVTVFVQEYESQRVTVEGWVKQPGVFPLKGRTTLLQVVALAGGLDRLADPEEVVIFRRRSDDKIEGLKVDLVAVREGRIKDPVLRPRDVVVVPQAGGKALFEDVTRTLRGFIGFGTIGF